MEPPTESSGSNISVPTEAAGTVVPVRVERTKPNKPVVTTTAADTDFVSASPKLDFAGPGSAQSGSLDNPDASSSTTRDTRQGVPAPATPNPILDTPFNGALKSTEPTISADVMNQGSLLDQSSLNMSAEEAITEPKKHVSRNRLLGLALLGFGILAAILLGVRIELNKSKLQEASLTPSARLQQQAAPLTLISKQLSPMSIVSANNGVTVNGSLVLAPTVQPSNPIPGQLYYDQASHQVQYYDGTGFVHLQGGNVITNNTYNNTTVNNSYGGGTTVNNFYSTTASNTFVTNNISNGASIQGTVGTLAMFGSNGSTLADSLVSESGQMLTSAGNLLVQPSGDSTTTLRVDNAAGSTTLLDVDSTDSEISLGTGAGASIGYTKIGFYTGGDTANTGVLNAQKFTTTAGGTISSMSAYLLGGGSTHQYQFALYADNGTGSAPGAYIASSAVGSFAATIQSWYTLPITATLSPTTVYWLAFWSTNSTSGFAPIASNLGGGSSLGVGSNVVAWQGGPDNGLPATFPTVATSGSYVMSLYATYTGSEPALTINQYGTLTQNGAAVFQDPTDSTQALQVQDSIGNTVLDVDTADDSVSLGSTLVKPESDSTSAFQVQNASGNTTLLGVDTTDSAISLGVGAGAIYGSAHIGTLLASGYSSGTLQAFQFKTNAAGTLTSMSAYLGLVQDHNAQYQFAIYTDNGGQPGSYLASSSVSTIGNVGWNTLPLTAPTNVLASTNYWLVFWENTTSNALVHSSGYPAYSTTITSSTWQGGSDNGLPATFPSGGSTGTGALWSIYATFASNGPALTINSAGTLTQSGASLFQDPTDSTTSFQIQNSLGTALFTADTADMQITIGGPLTVSGSITVDGHIITGGSTPTIIAGAAATACGNGGSPSVTISGDDTAGTITVVTGSGGTCASGALAAVTFADTFGVTPHVVLNPDNIGSQALGEYSSSAPTEFTLEVANAPATAATYKWDYWAAQ